MVSRENEAKASKYRRGQQKPGHAAAQVPDDLIDRACTAWCAEFPPALPFDQMTEGGKRNLKIGIAAIIGVLDGELAALRKRLEATEQQLAEARAECKESAEEVQRLFKELWNKRDKTKDEPRTAESSQ
jgi:hypothetical protein